MDLKLIKNIYNLHIKCLEELDFNIIHNHNHEIIYSKHIKDCYSNFISNFDANNIEQFETIINNSDNFFDSVHRKTTIYLLPYMKSIYENRDIFFDKSKFDLMSTEVYQVYTDFDNLNNIETHCNFDIKLEFTKDMEKYSDILMQCYQSGDSEDPYGNLDDGYRESYLNYKELNNGIKTEFYFIKANNEIVGTTEGVSNSSLYGIYSLALKKDYRNKGIGKEVLKKQLTMCKNMGIDIAFLSTEQDFYPAKLYRKIGFKDLCEVYYYMKK